MPEPYVHLDVSKDNDVAVVRVKDESIDSISTEQVADELFSLVRRDGFKKIILNLGNIQFLQSMALGRFIALDKLVTEAQGKLRLCNLQSTVTELFEITGLDDVIDIRHDLDAARAGLSPE